MKFEHLNITFKEVKKFNIRKLKRKTIWKILKRIQRQNMKRYGSSLISSKVYELMGERCILFSNEEWDLILGKDFNKMLRIYKRKHSDTPNFWVVPKFNPIWAMFFRNQVSEC